MFRISNTALANSSVVTSEGNLHFNEEGLTQPLSEECARLLATIPGYGLRIEPDPIPPQPEIPPPSTQDLLQQKLQEAEALAAALGQTLQINIITESDKGGEGGAEGDPISPFQGLEAVAETSEGEGEEPAPTTEEVSPFIPELEIAALELEIATAETPEQVVPVEVLPSPTTPETPEPAQPEGRRGRRNNNTEH